MVSSKIAEVDIQIGVERNDLDIDLLRKKQKVGSKIYLKTHLKSRSDVARLSYQIRSNQWPHQPTQKRKETVSLPIPPPKISLNLGEKKKEYPPHYNLDNVYHYSLLLPARSCRPRRCPPGHREILHDLADSSSGNCHCAEEEASWCV